MLYILEKRENESVLFSAHCAVRTTPVGLAIPNTASDFLLGSEELKGVLVRHTGAFLRLKFQRHS